MSKTPIYNNEGKLVLVDWIEKPVRGERMDIDAWEDVEGEYEQKLSAQPQTPILDSDKPFWEQYIGKEIPDGVWGKELIFTSGAWVFHAIPKRGETPGEDVWDIADNEASDYADNNSPEGDTVVWFERYFEYMKDNYSLSRK